MSTTQAYVPPSLQLLERGELIKQGAEAKVYLLPSLLPSPSIFWPLVSAPSVSNGSAPNVSNGEAGPSRRPPGSPVILKYRFSKKYRHPTLDASLTKTRLSWEARALARAHRAGVVVPRVLWVDEVHGVLGLERVEGWSVREILGGGAEGEIEIEDDIPEEELPAGGPSGHGATIGGDEGPGEEEVHSGKKALQDAGVTQEELMGAIGAALARLHSTTLIHGDLTTSNMMVRLTPNGARPFEIVLIDFGLCSQAQYAEHYAVDLYVLERAFASTHPASEGLYAGVLEAYGEGMGSKWKDIERKLKEVRLRGRKRDMTG